MVQDESLQRKVENELAEGRKTEMRTELSCYLESAASDLPAEAARAAQQGTDVTAAVEVLFRQLVLAGDL